MRSSIDDFGAYKASLAVKFLVNYKFIVANEFIISVNGYALTHKTG